MNEFKVSVIIPVYNAKKYLQHAVESAVTLSEVAEIVLVDDKSPDDCYPLCLELQKKYSIIKVYTHPGHVNKGAGASRNLGIQMATQDYIAFLDADDWYLPNRFLKAKELFNKDKNIDGVYDATGYYYEETKTLDPDKLTTLRRRVSSRDLLYNLLRSDGGRFTTDAITLRKTVFNKSGLFDTTLRLHQDTHLWLKLAQVARLVPGELAEAVAIRRTHDQNRISHLNRDSRKLLHIKTFEWFEKQEKLDSRAFRIVFNRYVGAFKKSLSGRFFFSVTYLLKNPKQIEKLI